MKKKYLTMTGFLLIVVAVSKSLDILKGGAYLSQPNGVLAFLTGSDLITNAHVAGFAAVLEIAVALAIFFRRDTTGGVALLALLGTMLAGYKLAMKWIGVTEPCHCLGRFADWLPLSAGAIGYISNCVLIWMLVGSYSLLLLQLYKAARQNSLTGMQVDSDFS